MDWTMDILRGDSILRMVIEGKMRGKGTIGRPRQLMLHWMMTDRYGKLKEEAQQQEERQSHTLKPA